MTRYVSLIALLAVIVVMGVLSVRVMSSFLLPLFLAALLAALFHPVHRWCLQVCRGRHTLAAGLTTTIVLMLVLVPVAGVVGLSLFEAQQTLAALAHDRDNIDQKIGDLRDKSGLSIPFADIFHTIQLDLARLHGDDDGAVQVSDEDSIDSLQHHLQEFRSRLAEQLHRMQQIVDGRPESSLSAKLDWGTTQEGIDTLIDPSMRDADHPEITWEKSETFRIVQLLRDPDSLAQLEGGIDDLMRLSGEMKNPVGFRVALIKAEARFQTVQSILLGSSLRGSVIQLVNPSKARIESWMVQGRDRLQKWLPTITGQATNFMVQLLVGAGIMIVAMFYFLEDGAAMIRAAMRLSPLDDRYEEELLQEFDSVSRAVVMATLLSALAQGVLAAIGYAVAGVDKVILMTLLTTTLALIPFVGAAVVWLPVCLWLVFIEQRTFAGSGLAIYCASVVSTVDNLIKPMILHGQSRLHPLLALLSVLGGVQSLGPVGLIVGPMVVSFLQALLNMLRTEITALDGGAASDRSPRGQAHATDRDRSKGRSTPSVSSSPPSQPAHAGETPAAKLDPPNPTALGNPLPSTPASAAPASEKPPSETYRTTEPGSGDSR